MLWQPVKAVRMARQTVYALTEKRLLRLTGGKARKVDSVLLDQIGPISSRIGKDGYGQLSVQTHSNVDSDGDRITEKFEMLGVPDVARLERLLLENRTVCA